MTINITLRELKDKTDWGKACDLLGINEWCLNEGLANDTDAIQITEEQARELNIL